MASSNNLTPRGRRETQKKRYGDSICSSPVKFWEGFQKSEVSARNLAAGLWHLRFPSTPSTRSRVESSMPRLKGSKEVATKWNPTLNEAPNQFTVSVIHSRKLLKVGDQRSMSIKAEQKSVKKNVEQNLLQNLKEQKSVNKNVEQNFLQNLKEEKILWKRRERQKIKAKLDNLKGKLARERRSRERTELLNTKLVHELGEANLLAKRFMTNYEKEKRERELMEEVCNELATQVGEDKAKLMVILNDSEKICEEMKEERKMMQMADLWREERVQMKLFDAQLVLEDKYNQLIQLASSLQMLLISRGVELDTTEQDHAEFILKAVESVNIQRFHSCQ